MRMKVYSTSLCVVHVYLCISVCNVLPIITIILYYLFLQLYCDGVITFFFTVNQAVLMTEEPDTTIDCYLAISIDSLVLISEETKVRLCVVCCVCMYVVCTCESAYVNLNANSHNTQLVELQYVLTTSQHQL